MSKKTRQSTFAQIVREVQAEPQEQAPPRETPGLYADGTLVDEDGRCYSRG